MNLVVIILLIILILVGVLILSELSELKKLFMLIVYSGEDSVEKDLNAQNKENTEETPSS